jgi:hypothetical protein
MPGTHFREVGSFASLWMTTVESVAYLAGAFPTGCSLSKAS